MVNQTIVWLKEVGLSDIGRVGGKNASLGEMIQHLTPLGILVPDGFAITAEAYQTFLNEGQIADQIYALLDKTEVDEVDQLKTTGSTIRNWILNTPLPKSLINDIKIAYETLAKNHKGTLSVAVRSSATAEDLPEASFAGQQETILHVKDFPSLLTAIQRVYASLYTDRAISYRAHHGFAHKDVSLSVGVQTMVRSDLATSGVLFTLDTESGFQNAVFITGTYGLGELLVQGAVNPDEYYVYKPSLLENKKAILRRTLGSKQKKMIWESARSELQIVPVAEEEQIRFALTDAEIESLAHQAVKIEKHYGRPMDIEWAKDGENGKLYIVQARPETGNAKKASHNPLVLERYSLKDKGTVLVEGKSVGNRIGQGPVRVIKNAQEMHRVNPGDVLVTDMTDPDWEPIMKRAAAIVTNRGGRTCHAAIIARELGIPAVVGTGNATKVLKENEIVTVSCAEGDIGYVYQGKLETEINQINLESLPNLPVKMMMIVGNPERAFDFQRLPNAGIGLARLEFIIAQTIGIHPKGCLNLNKLDKALQETILQRTSAYESPTAFYVEKLVEGVASLAAAFWPKPVVVRMSDFKSNEYANLLGGHLFEPEEENPMLGFRGAGRYISMDFQDCFALECKALKSVREEYGLTNVEVMIPFVRTVNEAQLVIKLLSEHGLTRGEQGLRLIMMCEIPSNALLAERFLDYFDGFSIGSNDLTQLTLGLDRDSGIVAGQFDERNDAVKALLMRVIETCKKLGKSVGICGQGPSDHADFAVWLMEQGIDSISMNPDSVVNTWMHLAKVNPSQ